MAKMTKPGRRLVGERSTENTKREIRTPSPTTAERETLAARVKYAGSAKHKQHPHAFGLPAAPRDADDTLCDGHAGFSPADMERAPDLLRHGVRAGLIGHNDKQGDPTILWTIDANGWIYEARITTPTQAIYHAYPLLPSDPFAKIVINHYDGWAYPQDSALLNLTLTNARARYR